MYYTLHEADITKFVDMDLLSFLRGSVAEKAVCCALLFLSFAGYAVLLRRRNVRAAFIPGTVVSAVMLAMFAGGITGTLAVLMWITFLGGLGCLLFCGVSFFVRRPAGSLGSDFWLISVFILAVSVFFLFRLRDTILIGYDDFSHWGTVARDIISHDRLPLAADKQIMFKSYPPGTALFIYYVEKVAGMGEPGYFFAQQFLKLCFLSSLFIVTESMDSPGKKAASAALVTVAVFFLLLFGTSVLTLTVDTVLSCAGIFCFLTCCYPKKAFPDSLTLPILGSCAAVLIKNSGIYFFLIALAWILCEMIAGKRFRSRRSFRLFWMLLPVLVVVVWQWHVSVAFPNGLQAKHSMSMTWYSGIMSAKTGAEYSEEFSLIAGLIVNPQKNQALILLGALILAGVCSCRLMNRQNGLLRFIVFLLVVSVLYQVGMLAMYFTSMSHKEIMVQKGSDYARYNSTLCHFLIAMMLVCIHRIMAADAGQIVLNAAGAVCLLAGAVWVMAGNTRLEDLDPQVRKVVYNSDEDVRTKQQIEGMLDRLTESTGSGPAPGQLMIRITQEQMDNDYAYLKYMSNYILQQKPKLYADDNEASFVEYRDSSKFVYCFDLVNDTVSEITPSTRPES